jgi:hypothetical protein
MWTKTEVKFVNNIAIFQFKLNVCFVGGLFIEKRSLPSISKINLMIDAYYNLIQQNINMVKARLFGVGYISIYFVTSEPIDDAYLFELKKAVNNYNKFFFLLKTDIFIIDQKNEKFYPILSERYSRRFSFYTPLFKLLLATSLNEIKITPRSSKIISNKIEGKLNGKVFDLLDSYLVDKVYEIPKDRIKEKAFLLNRVFYYNYWFVGFILMLVGLSHLIVNRGSLYLPISLIIL